MYTIKWRGDKVRNSNSRGGRKPIAIGNHISAGSRESVYWWFTSPNNTKGSAQFLVGREGDIDQYVRLELAAWTQGLNPDLGDIAFATAPIVHEMGINPNLYMIGIEHEGYIEGHLNDAGEVETVSYGLDGDLTEKQFWATCWLHKFIQTEVQRIYNVRIPLNSHNVVGHFQIDPRRKPNCPGSKFPFNRLYTELLVADTMTLESFEEYIQFKTSNYGLTAEAYNFIVRFNYLKAYAADKKYGPEKKRKIMLMAPVMKQLGMQGEATAENIVERLEDVEKTAITEGKWQDEGRRKFNIAAQYAKQAGVM